MHASIKILMRSIGLPYCTCAPCVWTDKQNNNTDSSLETKVGAIADIAASVDRSATCNISQIVFVWNGSMVVSLHEWVTYLAPHLRQLSTRVSFQFFIRGCTVTPRELRG